MPQNQLLDNSLDVWTISSEFRVTGNSRWWMQSELTLINKPINISTIACNIHNKTLPLVNFNVLN